LKKVLIILAVVVLLVVAGVLYVIYSPTAPRRLVPVQSSTYQPDAPQDVAAYPLFPDTTIRNIILFIGDGMGINQITVARTMLFGPNGRLHLERLPDLALAHTPCASPDYAITPRYREYLQHCWASARFPAASSKPACEESDKFLPATTLIRRYYDGGFNALRS